MKLYLGIIGLLLISSARVHSQSFELAAKFQEQLTGDFIWNSQNYEAEPTKDDPGEFMVTFYGGARYRIFVCSNILKSKLKYSVYDQKDNLLFDSAEHNYPAFWDFSFKFTMDCKILLQLNDPSIESANVFLFIGHKLK